MRFYSFLKTTAIVSILFIIIFCIPCKLKADNDDKRKILWRSNYNLTTAPFETNKLYFNNAIYDLTKHNLPFFFEKFDLPLEASSYSILLSNEIFEPLNEEEKSLISVHSTFVFETIKTNNDIGIEQKTPKALVSFIPIRKNPSTGKYEKLVAFDLTINPIASSKKREALQKTYQSNSILATGNWYKLAVKTNGIYKLSFSFLKKAGIDVNSINPKNIRIYGNGGGMLSNASSTVRKEDLFENAIYVEDGSDGKFDSTDYVLFYGESPNKWIYSSTDKKFHHQTHLYSDSTYYFLNLDLGTGKRIARQAESSQPITDTVNSFDDVAFHEIDAQNLIKSGREWYGEFFDVVTSYSIPFNFSNLSLSSNPNVSIKTDIAARSATASTFKVACQSASTNLNPAAINLGDYTGYYASTVKGSFNAYSNTSNFNVIVSKETSSAIGWLNYIEVNARRDLIMTGDQLIFRDKESSGLGNVSKFNLSNANAAIKLWEITDPTNIKEQNTSLNSNQLSFILTTDSIREFIAFNGASYLTPQFSERVENQNLHASAQVDMIIVSHPEFLSEANTLANLHATNDTITSIVVTPQQIYNEFSSGSQDISAIRDFVKLFYDRAGNNALLLPKYLLLVGDGSYDNKKRFSNNTNFIPTYQTINSTAINGSYVFDDFYGCLDDNEGNLTNDIVDIGIGRLPVKSKSEAQGVVNKIIAYSSKNNLTSNSFGDWRNSICFVADDQMGDNIDGNIFVSDANGLATAVDTSNKAYNIDKIYQDAYLQETTPGGHRYPEATEAFNRRVEKGTLIIDYIGHGGVVGLAHERLIEINDINSWKNINNLPLFITATCEFSRFDDPERTSAGEYVLLNPDGGGIALLTTTRVAYEGPNMVLNTNFFKTAFSPINGSMPRLGDICRLTKAASGSSDNIRNFTLLGDPALRLSYPKHNIATQSINGSNISVFVDTIKALSSVTISGYVTDKKNNKLSNYSGTLYPTIYDKEQTIKTLSNNISPASSFAFGLQKNIIYKGKASIVNGEFSFSFIVPIDINKQFGLGKISYYAENGNEDANGYFEKIIVGGYSSNAAIDNVGPDIKLYLNDTKFVTGGITDENPYLYAKILDSSGVNTTGGAIGHDIISVLDENTSKSKNLNDYYQSDLNSYKSGSVKYPFSGLEEGKHTLKLKVWDVHNNSSQAYTEFIVAKSAQLAISHVLNYPNPFTTKTSFYFEHNQFNDVLTVQIQIFTVSGKLVKTIDTYVHTDGFKSDPIDWDGKDDFGDNIGKGVYVYRIKVKTSSGTVADKFEKLVVLK